ncbi:MAG TPA: acetyltransferase [Actinomycetota bacterium]|nr:acetyltransferase [Actinomycetota bacterium]
MSGSRPRVVLLGGGGHARVLLDCLLLCGGTEIVGMLEADSSRVGAVVYGVSVLGNDDLLAELVGRGATHFIVGIGSVGDNGARRRLFKMGLAQGLRPLLVRHPSAIVSPRAQVGEGCQLLPGCIVNAGAVLGQNVLVNTAAIVEHDCVVADHVHLATGSRLASTVRVEEGAHLGAGAVVRQSVKIGARAIVGAGAVVVRDVPGGAVVVGVPARPLGGLGR